MSLSTNESKFVRSLRLKKFRQKYNNFTVEGDKMVRELAAQQRYTVQTIYALPEWPATAPECAALPTVIVTERELAQLSQLTTPNAVLAVVSSPPPQPIPNDLDRRFSLYLDGLQVPANLGAILRVADWFGFSDIILGPGTVDPYAAKSVQAGMGSFLRLNLYSAELAELAEQFPAYPIYGADMAGRSIFSIPLAERPPAVCLVIGSEGPGIRPATRELITDWVSVPRAPGRVTESLNAAVAAGILISVLANGG
ncbi:MAG: RNA methyltransferase [Saprospiraceae bacterium]